MLALVGMVVQLAKLSRLTVVTTASSRNAEYLKPLGADLSPHDPNTPAEIKKLTHSKFHAYDMIYEEGNSLSAPTLASRRAYRRNSSIFSLFRLRRRMKRQRVSHDTCF
jgi:NADPH:quinone reductase-like Zn-dependent oxidoreductase